ncbi:uncharacterized protein LOC111315312 [Durio zibethinus]|uniref:Uncharacterized protein LOC111315312 n=1 Tax=Durio zibethinus TaxID=66656 RepID=A0A6P6B6L9_DURZI|nr:uncharacterized protein LOC111315312 [Durio zibethinus]
MAPQRDEMPLQVSSQSSPILKQTQSPSNPFRGSSQWNLQYQKWKFGDLVVRLQRKSRIHTRKEELFTEQRRKVDLKTFSNWEDSPEKMMMEMMAARRSLSN